MLRFFLTCIFLTIPLSAIEPPVDFRFRAEVLAEGMPQPMHLVRLDDGRIFFTELAGKIRMLNPGSKEIQEVGTVAVTTAQENGLLGMALDPAFLQNGWMYLLHSPEDYPGQILSRFTIVENKLVMASRKDLMKWEEQRRECCHHAGTIRFGPDGCLYIATGDNTHPHGDSAGYSPIDERPEREPWDAQKSSGNTNDLRGKILRIKPTPEGGYTIPEGNLFPPGTPLTRPEIYAMGLRNPWRFAIDSQSGFVYSGDVGPDAGGPNKDRGPQGYDTINQIRKAGNFGWPYVRGKEAYREFDFAAGTAGEIFDPAKPVNNSRLNTGAKELPPVVEPFIWYPSGGTEAFPLLKSGGRTACGGPAFHFNESFRDTGGFPEYYDNCVLIYDWQRPFLLWVRLDESSNIKEMLPFPGIVRVAQGNDDGSGKLQIRRPVDMTFGSDGALYILDYGETWGANANAQLVRISFQWGNLSPVAQVKAGVTAGKEPLTLEMNSEGSSDQDGDSLTREWRLHPGDKLLGSETVLKTVLSDPGVYTMELRVMDGKGGVASANVPVTVGNSPPEVAFESPRDGDFFTVGQPVKWKVHVKDAEDGDSAAKPDVMGMLTLVSSSIRKGTEEDLPPGLTLMKQSDCFNCHAIEQKLVGPAFVEIADKYRGQSGAEDVSVGRIRIGSSNVWGPLPMLPHPQHTDDELHHMVRYIFSLEKGKGGPTLTRGLTGESAVPDDAAITSVVLDASYTDSGLGAVPPITRQSSVTLRPRKFEAELAPEIRGPMVLGFAQASGGKGLGSIGHGHFLAIKAIPLDQCDAITCRVAGAGTGGVVEIRADKADGELLASIEVKPTGDWDKWVDASAPIPAGKGMRDVFVVFNKPGVSGGMMNLDWLRFDKVKP